MPSALRSRKPLAALGLAVLLLTGAPARAAEPALTMREALSLAAEAPLDVRAAAARLEEARARGALAAVRPNPALEAAVGPRFTPDGGVGLDLEVGVDVPLDLAGRQALRAAIARADLARAESALAAAQREAALATLRAFCEVAAAEARAREAEAALTFVRELRDAVAGRQTAGTGTGLDLLVAEAEITRAESDLKSARHGQSETMATLATLLGRPELVSRAVATDLRACAGLAADAAALAAAPSPAASPTLSALDADRDAALAEARLAEAARHPEVSVGGAYTHEEGAHIALARIGVTLPVWDDGRAEAAVARARASGLTAEREALAARLDAAAEGARRAYRLAADAADHTGDAVVPRFEAAVALATEGWLAGKLALSELVALRRDLLAVRAAHTERLAIQARAGLDLLAATGAALP